MQQQKRDEKVDHGEQEQTVAGHKKKRKRARGKRSKKHSENSKGCSDDNLALEETPLNNSEPHQKQMAKPVTPVVDRKAAGSNWETAIGKTVPAKDENNKPSEQQNVVNVNVESGPSQDTNTLTKAQRRRQKRRAAQQKYVAMDCEMVGVGLNGQDDMLARVSIVNKSGEVLLDKFVKPQQTVIDYRTSVSGIRPHDIANGEDIKEVQDQVVQILQGKILIGHGLSKDLAVLRIKHPKINIRDTAFYKPLRRLVSNGRTPSLKRLSQDILGKEIQTGEHNSVEDARAVMSIYNCLASDWEQYIKRHQHKSK